MLARAFVVNAFGFMCFEMGKKLVYSKNWVTLNLCMYLFIINNLFLIF